MSTKQKVDSIRTYDEDGYRRRAACVCIRDLSQKEVLLVSTNNDPDLWIVPGGGVEPTEKVEEAAVREVLEEAGVKGTIEGCLGLFESIECKHRTMVYLMVVRELLTEWQEALSIGRRRRWFTMDEARNHLQQHRPSHRRYLDNLYHASKPASGDTANTNEAKANSCNNAVSTNEANTPSTAVTASNKNSIANTNSCNNTASPTNADTNPADNGAISKSTIAASDMITSSSDNTNNTTTNTSINTTPKSEKMKRAKN